MIASSSLPAAPRRRRSSRLHATLKVKGSKARGSKIVKFAAQCTPQHSQPVSSASRGHRVRLHGLVAGTAYECRARAVAKAGHGHWSAQVSLPRP